MQVINTINLVVAILVFVCCFHQYLYMFIPFFKKHKPHRAAVNHRYAILISARNEEKVIGELINSIKHQNYPSHLVTVFVVADNCTDGTAAVARKAGAVVWERSNQQEIGKGYALDFLLNHIKEAYPDDPFDAFMVFDADNLLDENYITEMNKTFSDGYEMITSYRNSKNFGDNWITAGYGMMFLREAKYINNSRMLLNTSCAISGTGFLFSREIKNKLNGWHFHLLTEDIQFTAHNVMKGRKIAYCPTAILYDEQPVTFQQSWTQRLRWAKGYLQVFVHYCFGLGKGIFALRSFSCYDFFMTLIPASIISVAAFVMNLIATVVGLCVGADVSQTIWSVAMFFINMYVVFFVMAIFVVVSEWKQIHCSTVKKIKYVFTFPIFMFTYTPIGVAALFRKVEWKPIQHGNSKVNTLSDLKAIQSPKKKAVSAQQTAAAERKSEQPAPVPKEQAGAYRRPSYDTVTMLSFERLQAQQHPSRVIHTTALREKE